MITNFQIKPRKCKYHNLTEDFICLNHQCHYRALLCSDCTRQNHVNHLYDVYSIDSFTEVFKSKVKFYEDEFQKDKMVINVKEIVKAKLGEMDQALGDILVSVVKMIQTEKYVIKQKLKTIEDKYELIEAQYKKHLQIRMEYLDYLSAYKNSPQALQAKLFCSSQWGVVSLKNALTDIQNLSLNQHRDLNFIAESIINQAKRALEEDNFIYNLKQFVENANRIKQYSISGKELSSRNPSRMSFIESSLHGNLKSSMIAKTNNTNNGGLKSQQPSALFPNVPKRPRTTSLTQIIMPKAVSARNITPSKQKSLQKTSLKTDRLQGLSSIQTRRYLKGLKKLPISHVIIE